MDEKELQDLERHVKAKPNGYKENRDECWFITKVQRQKILDLIAEVRRLQEEKRVMKKALKFYADENGYVTYLCDMDITATVMIDKGEWARKVLDQVKGAVEGERD